MTSDILKRAAEAVEKFSMWDVIPYEDDPLVDGLLRGIAAARTLIPDMAAAIAERDAENARLTARAEAAEAQVANAGAVMVDAALRLPAYDSDGDPAWQFDHHVFVRRDDLRALSTLSPIAAAARVLLADDVAISRMAEAIHDGPLGAEGHWFSAATEQGGWCVDVVRAGLRALAEQDAKPPTEYERKVAQMKEDFPNGI